MTHDEIKALKRAISKILLALADLLIALDEIEEKNE